MNVFRIPEFLSEKESAICYERVLEIEDDLMALGEHNYPSVKGDKLTGRYQYYNALQDKVVGPIVLPKYLVLFGRGKWLQAWFNAFRKGDRIEPHKHFDRRDPLQVNMHPFTSCNLYLGGDCSSGTIYEGKTYENHVGELLIFHAGITHWTESYEGDDVRVTMATDIHVRKNNPVMFKLK